ncbi:30S ribosomal protein S4 [candidate division WOR-3 bacterium]|nr:30S ribosomal protein S4 [candidate division WOR-3 bacterium]
MSRYRGPKTKLERRENMYLSLKQKNKFEKRPYIPGEAKNRRTRRLTGYGEQLREKQKVKRMYGLQEKQFHNYFLSAAKSKGITGDILLQILERRLDNTVFRVGFAPTRASGRQLVSHGHILVNGKKINIPSYQVSKGDTITVREKGRKIPVIIETIENASKATLPSWLQLNSDEFKGVVLELPSREDITTPINDNLIIELYSK